LISLGLNEQEKKQEKPKASKGKGSTSKRTAKLKEVSPVARWTRSSKVKIKFLQEEEIKMDHKSSASKHEFIGYDRVYTWRMTK